MNPFRRILVPRDYSPTSERALEAAIDLARRSRADLHLLHVEVLYGDPVQVREDAARALSEETIRERLGDAGAVHVASERAVAAAPAILRYADEQGVDLIALGTHGRRGVRRLLLGSVTEEVVRAASCALLTVHVDHRLEPVERVMVPVDFSVSSRRAVMRAKELSALYGAELHALHVTPQVPFPAFYGIDATTVTSQYADRAERELRRFIDTADGPEVGEVSITIQTGQPSRRITDYAERHAIDRIVMGTRGLSGLQHVLLGSATERTLRVAPCPVLISRLPDDVEPGPADY